jgi:hypothetical protein
MKKDLLNIVHNKVDCNIEKCKNENNILIDNLVIYGKAKLLALNKFKNNIISKKEYLNYLIIIKKLELKTEFKQNEIKCALDNCYKLTEEYLDSIISTLKIKYKKPSKYTIDDYIKIMLLQEKAENKYI